MSDAKLFDLIEILYPYFLKRLTKEGFFKNCVKAKMATVVSSENGKTKVKFPYDTNIFEVRDETGVILKAGDNVCIFYWIDLKNAVAVFKI